ncbi:hypothetical protein ACQI4L_08815 [Mycolicibacterium litorale]|uniref:hypothetical protein n=1 Tax=Mycolicibacterium litorale TaxID=758802 RepID=UPI003CFA06D2
MSESRPESDDYDLLTFGEVAARISEELTEASAQLERARGETPTDTDEIRRIEDRIAMLRESADRYRQEQQTNASFTRRFGPLSSPPSGPPPQWR